MEIGELIKTQGGENLDYSKVIDELKSKRYLKDPDTGKFESELNPVKHAVFDKIKRPDKRVRVDPEDVEMLQDLVKAAVNEAMIKVQAEMAEQMSKVTGGLNIPGLF